MQNDVTPLLTQWSYVYFALRHQIQHWTWDKAVYVYIYNCWKKVQSQVICTTMVSWIIPIVRQSKTDLNRRQMMRPLRHGGSHFVNALQNGCLHDVRDASFVCDLSQFLTAWRLVLSMIPWSYLWLEIGLFTTIIAIIRACACWALFVVTLTNTVHFIYINICNSSQAQHKLFNRMSDMFYLLQSYPSMNFALNSSHQEEIIKIWQANNL